MAGEDFVERSTVSDRRRRPPMPTPAASPLPSAWPPAQRPWPRACDRSGLADGAVAGRRASRHLSRRESSLALMMKPFFDVKWIRSLSRSDAATARSLGRSSPSPQALPTRGFFCSSSDLQRSSKKNAREKRPMKTKIGQHQRRASSSPSRPSSPLSCRLSSLSPPPFLLQPQKKTKNRRKKTQGIESSTSSSSASSSLSSCVLASTAW